MSWHYSQALVEEYSAANYLDGVPFAPWKSIPSVPDDSCSGKMKGTCHRSPFGMMFVPSTDTPGAALLTWFQAGFPAKTSVLPGRETGLTATALDFGRKWRESSVKYDPASRSWKTHQCSLLGDWEPYSETWPRSGTMRNGECWERQTLERRTKETGSGLLPTPLASNTKAHHMRGADKGKKREPRSYLTWATPTVCGNYNRKGASKNSGDGLATMVAKWPTPTVNDSKNSTLPPSQIKHDNIPGALLRSGHPSGGQLNPTWVEWLMGWPLGWTDCKPLAMDKCHSVTQRLAEGF